MSPLSVLIAMNWLARRNAGVLVADSGRTPIG